MKYLFLLIALVLSLIINELLLDYLMDIFKLMMDVVYLQNRITLTLFFYFIFKYIYDKNKNKSDNSKYLIKNLSIIYIVWLVGLLFGRVHYLPDYDLKTHFNFRSFLPYWFHHLDNQLVLLYIIGNILVYIPFGLVVRYYFRIILSIIICFGTILFFELLQGITNLGFFDIDDIILNGIGGILGIVFMTLFLQIFPNKGG